MMPISPESWTAVSLAHFDLAIFCCGYEHRSTFISRNMDLQSTKVIWIDYDAVGIHSYDENRLYFDGLGGTRISASADIEDLLDASLSEFFSAFNENNDPQILFDVSSCSRKTMAQVVLSMDRRKDRAFVASYTYALSAWDSPPSSELPSHISEPVVGDLSGWSEDLSKPPCAIIGLGFEPGRALGCIDYLEIPGVRLFLPHGPDIRFEDAVVLANRSLVSEVGSSSVLHYNVMDPCDTYQRLESLLFGLIPRSRPVIIPLGPKIFSAVSICLAVQMLPKVCVWRTSAGVNETTTDRRASGEVSCFSIRWETPVLGSDYVELATRQP